MNQTEDLEFWIDLNLPPALASWLISDFKVSAKSFNELGFNFTTDAEIFKKAKQKGNAIVITTKDIDFVYLAEEIGTPPRILYINTGNISNQQLREIINHSFEEVIRIFEETDQTLIELIP